VIPTRPPKPRIGQVRQDDPRIRTEVRVHHDPIRIDRTERRGWRDVGHSLRIRAFPGIEGVGSGRYRVDILYADVRCGNLPYRSEPGGTPAGAVRWRCPGSR